MEDVRKRNANQQKTSQSKQFSLPKISSILQEMKISPMKSDIRQFCTRAFNYEDDYSLNIMGDKLLLNFGAKFQR